jgi:hypothetical protein
MSLNREARTMPSRVLPVSCGVRDPYGVTLQPKTGGFPDTSSDPCGKASIEAGGGQL